MNRWGLCRGLCAEFNPHLEMENNLLYRKYRFKSVEKKLSVKYLIFIQSSCCLTFFKTLCCVVVLKAFLRAPARILFKISWRCSEVSQSWCRFRRFSRDGVQQKVLASLWVQTQAAGPHWVLVTPPYCGSEYSTTSEPSALGFSHSVEVDHETFPKHWGVTEVTSG